MNHVLTHRPGGAGLAVDIASWSSRSYWLVPAGMARAILAVPKAIFTSFNEALAARAAVDPAPAIVHHKKAGLRCGDAVDVGDERTGTLAWIHTNGDVRVRFADTPEHAEYYPIAAIRRAVQSGPAARFTIEEVSAGRAHALARELGGHVGSLREGALALMLRRSCDGAVAGVLACSRPNRLEIDDGLTLEIRGVVTADDTPQSGRWMLKQACRVAAEQGYRRLVVRGHAVKPLLHALHVGGWGRERLTVGCAQAASTFWWAKVLRAAELGAQPAGGRPSH